MDNEETGGDGMSVQKTRLQVMWNRLLAVVEEQGQALIRAAFSPIVRDIYPLGLFLAVGTKKNQIDGGETKWRLQRNP